MFLKKLFNYKNIIEDKYVYIFVMIIGFITYSYTFYHFTYNQDGIGRVFRETMNFKQSISIGRWSYFIFYNLLNRAVNIPIIIGSIVIIINSLTSYYIFQIFNIQKAFIKIIVGSLFMTFPGFIYYFYYLGDVGVYAIAMFLFTLGIYIFLKGNNFMSTLISITLATLALASYPALFSYLSILILFYVIYAYTIKQVPTQKSAILLIKLTFYSLISLLIFFISSKIFQLAFDIEINNYKGAAELNIVSLIKKLPYKIVWVFLLMARYVLNASLIIKILIAINFGSIFYLLYKRSKKMKDFMFSILLLFLIVPYVFSIYLITYEKWPYAGFEFGFLIFLSIPFILFIKEKIFFHAFYIIFILAIFTNMQTINKVSIEHQLNVEASRHIISNMIHEIQKTPNYKGSMPIVLIGDLKNNTNFTFSDIIPHSTLYNSMEIPAGFAGSNISGKIKNQAALLNVKLNVIKTNANSSKYMPKNHYPKEGSMKITEDTLYINIGATPKIKALNINANKESKNTRQSKSAEEGSLKSNPIAQYLLERI